MFQQSDLTQSFVNGKRQLKTMRDKNLNTENVCFIKVFNFMSGMT